MTDPKQKNHVFIISALRRKTERLEDALLDILDAADIDAAHQLARKALEISEKK